MIGEIGVRALTPAPPRSRITEPEGYSPFVDTPKGLYVYRPGAAFAHLYDVSGRRGRLPADGRVAYRINNLGFRGGDVTVEKPPGVRRILCLGDSFTFGEGVREEDAWPARLGQMLGPRAQVLNAGVQGYDFDHEALFLLLHGRQLKPDVVVLAFFMNDAMPFGRTIEHHMLVTESPAEESPLARVSRLWDFFVRRRSAASRSNDYLEELRASFAGEKWRSAKGRLAKLRTMADRDGFRIVGMIFPLLYRFDDYPLAGEHADVRSAFAAAGIEMVDLLEPFRAHRAEDLWVHVTDPHPNEVAHRIAAERLAALLVMPDTQGR